MRYEIYDGNPSEVGGTEWPDVSGGPDAKGYDDADELASDALDWAVSQVDGNSDYAIGDTLWCIVRYPEGSIAVTSRETS
jgi:hypothetical protein